MDNMIIDPSTLTEEQREIIHDDYNFNADMAAHFGNTKGSMCDRMSLWHQGRCDELIYLFGKEFFHER